MGRNIVTALAILSIIVGVLQKTPLAFLSPDAVDFVWGLAIGLSIGAIVSWAASPRRA